MKLLSIECSHFRQHVDTRIEFQSGLTGIIGSNGSGKSTLVEAIAFALFGSRAVRGKLEDVVTRGAKRSRTAVCLRFEHGGHVFVIERSLSDASLVVGGSREAMVSGNRAVTERVAEILGLSYDEFIATYCTEQKGLEFLSGKRGATERARFITRMMGYDRLEQAQEILRKDRRDLKNQLLGMESSVQDETELAAAVAREKKKLQELAAESAQASAAVEAASKEFEAQESKWRAVERAQEQFERLRTNRDRLQARIEGLTESERSSNETLREREEALAGILAAVAPWNGARDVLDEERQALQSEHEDLAEKMQTLRAEWEERRVQASSASGVAAAAVAQRQAELDDLEQLQEAAHCPTCGQELGDSCDALRQRARSALETARKELEGAREQVAAVRPEPAALGPLTTRSEALGKRRQELQRAEGLFDRLDQLQTEVTGIRARLAQYTGERNDLEKELGVIQQQIESLPVAPEDFKKQRLAYDTGRQLLEVSRMKRLRHEGEFEKQKALLERSEADMRKAKELRIRLEQQRRELLLLEESDSAITAIRRSLNASIRPRLADLSSEFLADLTDGRYSTVEISDDFTPTVFEDGEPKAVISGGEQDILNLCVRLALSQLVAERAGHAISLLVLDEVFGSLDESRRYNVLMLLEKLQNRFEQVLLITHLDDIKEGVHHFINVEYDEGSGEVHIDALDSYELVALNI